MSEPTHVNTEQGEVVLAEVTSEEEWMAVHDLLLDRWLELYEAHKARWGFPVGKAAVWPVQIVANVQCMHNCGCENDSDFMFGVTGHQEGSRHATLRLVTTCEGCLRRSGAVPESEIEGGVNSGPIQ